MRWGSDSEGNAMKPTAIAKRAVDVLMTLALLFLMGYQLWGRAPTSGPGRGCSFCSLRITS